MKTILLLMFLLCGICPDHQTLTGELGYAGGAYGEYEGCKLAFAFSGATSEEDLVVAKYGIERMKGYMSNK